MLSVLLAFIRSDFALQQAAYVIFVWIVGIRVRLGYFPTYTIWMVLSGSSALLQLWLRQRSETPPLYVTPSPT